MAHPSATAAVLPTFGLFGRAIVQLYSHCFRSPLKAASSVSDSASVNSSSSAYDSTRPVASVVDELLSKLVSIRTELLRKSTLTTSVVTHLITSPTPHAIANTAPTPAPLTVLCGYLLRAMAAYEKHEKSLQLQSQKAAASAADSKAASAPAAPAVADSLFGIDQPSSIQLIELVYAVFDMLACCVGAGTIAMRQAIGPAIVPIVGSAQPAAAAAAAATATETAVSGGVHSSSLLGIDKERIRYRENARRLVQCSGGLGLTAAAAAAAASTTPASDVLEVVGSCMGQALHSAAAKLLPAWRAHMLQRILLVRTSSGAAGDAGDSKADSKSAAATTAPATPAAVTPVIHSIFENVYCPAFLLQLSLLNALTCSSASGESLHALSASLCLTPPTDDLTTHDRVCANKIVRTFGTDAVLPIQSASTLEMLSHALHFIRCAARVAPQLLVAKSIVSKIATIMVVTAPTPTAATPAADAKSAPADAPPAVVPDAMTDGAAGAAAKKKKKKKSGAAVATGSSAPAPASGFHSIQILNLSGLDTAVDSASTVAAMEALKSRVDDATIRGMALRAVHELCVQVNIAGDVERPSGRVIAAKLIENGVIDPLLARMESTPLHRSLAVECVALLCERVEGRRFVMASPRTPVAIFKLYASEKHDAAAASAYAFLLSRVLVSPDWVTHIDQIPIAPPAAPPASAAATGAAPPPPPPVVCDVMNVAWQWTQSAHKQLGKRWAADDTERAVAVLLSRSMMVLNGLIASKQKNRLKRFFSLGVVDLALQLVDHWWIDVSKAALGILFNLSNQSPQVPAIVNKIEDHKKWLKRMLDLFLSENGLDATASMVERGRLILECILNLSDHSVPFRSSLTDYLSAPNTSVAGSRYPLARMIEEMRNDRKSGAADEDPFIFPSPILTSPHYQTDGVQTNGGGSAAGADGGTAVVAGAAQATLTASSSPNALAIAEALKRLSERKGTGVDSKRASAIIDAATAATASAAAGAAPAAGVTCGHCAKHSIPSLPAFKLCGGCRAVSYCSVDCQRSHWKLNHKRDCKRSST